MDSSSDHPTNLDSQVWRPATPILHLDGPVRFTLLIVSPGQNWSGQYSYARIKSPEATSPSEDQERMTGSVMYNHPLVHGDWANTVLWGRIRSLVDSAKENSYLLESSLGFKTHNYVWMRAENAGRSNELLNE